MPGLWLGLDVGTTAVKAAAYLPDGELVASADAPSPVVQTMDGGNEQDMATVWQTVSGVLAELADKCSGESLSSLGVCAQGDGLWCVDADGQPAGPAILWNDTRSARDLKQLEASGATAAVGRGCHTSLWSGTSGMLWRWVRSKSPEVAEQASHVMTCADWVGFNLTGELATDYSDASIPFLDLNSRKYGRAQIEALDCEDIADRLLEPRNANSLLGRISTNASGSTSLPSGLPVSVGTLDLSAMLVGMAMDRPGQTMMIMGTTAVVNILTDSVDPSDAPVGASVLHPTSEVIIRVLAPTSGAAAFDWFSGLNIATRSGQSAADTAERMNELIDVVPVGSNGVTFLPYLSGERAPFVAPAIRASFHGLSATTTAGDLGRAVMEGTALSLRHCFEEEAGLPVETVQLTGGGSRNASWCQIIADVVGQTVLVSDASDQGLWGAACIGASAAGFGDPVALARRDTQFTRYDPDAVRHRDYGEVFSRYALLSKGQRATQSELSLLEEAVR